MKLGILAGAGGAKIRINLDRIKHAENLGYDSVWTAEAWGGDAVTSAAWMLAHTTRINVGTAIMQMPGRCFPTWEESVTPKSARTTLSS